MLGSMEDRRPEQNLRSVTATHLPSFSEPQFTRPEKGAAAPSCTHAHTHTTHPPIHTLGFSGPGLQFGLRQPSPEGPLQATEYPTQYLVPSMNHKPRFRGLG